MLFFYTRVALFVNTEIIFPLFMVKITTFYVDFTNGCNMDRLNLDAMPVPQNSLGTYTSTGKIMLNMVCNINNSKAYILARCIRDNACMETLVKSQTILHKVIVRI